MNCSDFLADRIPNFHDATADCLIRPDSWRFIHQAADGTDFLGIVAHHSGTMKADNPGAIARWQYEKHGWPISYNWLITKRGLVYQCKNPNIRSPQCGNRRGNMTMVCFCVEGNLAISEPTCIQIKQTQRLLRELEVWKGASFGIIPHKAISKTLCPGVLVDRLELFAGSQHETRLELAKRFFARRRKLKGGR